MSHYESFEQDKIDAALATAKLHYELDHPKSLAGSVDLAGHDLSASSGELSISAGCITVSVENHQICLNLPIVGKKCFPIPSWIPNGAKLQACLSICTTFGIPTGVKVTVSFNGHVIISKSFGKC